MCALALVSVPGCGGCGCNRGKPKTAEELAKERAERRARLRQQEKKKKKPLEVTRFVSLPYEPHRQTEGTEETPACFFKPGHWTTTLFSAKANRVNIMGDLWLTATNGGGRPLGLEGTPFAITARRRVALPKGQQKTFRSVLFVPESAPEAWAAARIEARQSAGLVQQQRYRVGPMPFYQYYFVVLARYPEWYTYLKTLDSLHCPTQLVVRDPSQRYAYYRVALVPAGRRTPLPSYGLFWTSIAYVLWDDIDPDSLSLDQQVALLDWLHWGGQLILSGPDTLDGLRDSFLADYLPATAAGRRSLSAADLEEINRHWSLPLGNKPGRKLAPVGTWSAVQLEKRPQARFVPNTGELLAQRRVGRGRVVVSAFKLSGRELTGWPGFDGFFNGCLLGRPPRRFRGSPEEFDVTWADDPAGQPFSPGLQYATERLCRLHYFSRDEGRQPTTCRSGQEPVVSLNFEPRQIEGLNLASWNDFSATATAARQCLQDAAGIEVPKRSFIVWVVGVYLLVLVPVNWLVFRLIDRVEWAWLAAPAVAIACTLLVIQLAQLDIGFARSRNEIAVVELQGDYPRAHVTRYTALYTSLASGYDFHFDDPGAQILPFPSSDNRGDSGLLLGDQPRPLEYRHGAEVALDHLPVRSSFTQLMHSEQMVDLGGPIALVKTSAGSLRLVNRTGLALDGAGLIRCDREGRVESAWVGSLEPEETVPLDDRWRAVSAEQRQGPCFAPQRRRDPLTAPSGTGGGLNIGRLVQLAEAPQALRPGDVRLVAWAKQDIAGLKIKPASAQSLTVALVVANLRYGPIDDPRPDKNLRLAVAREPIRTVPVPSGAGRETTLPTKTEGRPQAPAPSLGGVRRPAPNATKTEGRPQPPASPEP